jgi:mono/diheme cytochrome c family protein
VANKGRNSVAAGLLAVGVVLTSVVSGFQAAGTASGDRHVYASGDAERGKRLYADRCAQCHGDDLGGTTFGDGAPALRRDDFATGRDLQVVFDRMTRAMPFDAPASLTSSEYADVFSYLLRENGAAGTADSSAPDSPDLASRDGAPGPKPGQLVQVVGCVAVTGPDNWLLTRASVPVPSNSPDLTAGERRALEATTLGDGPAPPPPDGRRVAAKGLLGQNGIAVTSMEKLGSRCDR